MELRTPATLASAIEAVLGRDLLVWLCGKNTKDTRYVDRLRTVAVEIDRLRRMSYSDKQIREELAR